MLKRLRQHLQPPRRDAPERVIYLSGLPGSGKTTITRQLAQRLHATVIPEFLEPIPQWVIATRRDAPISDRIAAQRWVIAQHAAKNLLVREAGREGAPVLVDRTFVDAALYAAAYGADTLEATLDELDQHTWVRGLFLILYAKPDVIKSRMIARADCNASDWEAHWRGFVEQLLAGALELATMADIYAVDNSDLQLEETLAIVHEAVETAFGSPSANGITESSR